MSSVSLTPAKITTNKLPTETVNSQAAIIHDFMEGGDYKKRLTKKIEIG